MSIVPWMKYNDIKCKNCTYYTGIQCHGHGEYYGTCKLAEKILKLLETDTDKYLTSDQLPEYIDDESTCPFVKEWLGPKEKREEK